MVEEKQKIILLESHKVFLALEFLLREEKECLTDYGRGLLNGLLDPATTHKIPVVAKEEYVKILKENTELKRRLKRSWFK